MSSMLLSWLIHLAASTALDISVTDLKRAANREPKPAYQGQTFAGMSAVLNRHLAKIPGLSTAHCSNFTVQQIQESVLLPIFQKASPELLSIYALRGDNRHREYSDEEDARREWVRLRALASPVPGLQAVLRDGLCHQAVMWFVHHVSEPIRRELAQQLVLPLLPEHRHDALLVKGTDHRHAEILADYETKVSCQQCHIGPVWKSWEDATLPLPLPPDPQHPGRERLKSCDYQNKPPCEPCEGLGGPRRGDGLEQFDPVNCSVVARAADIPDSDRPKPAFPSFGHANINGETRQPLAVRPDPKKPGKYPKVDSTISLAWGPTMRRQRYDFQNMPPLGKSMAQIYLQTAEQAQSGNSAGVMVTIMGTSKYTPNLCICMDAVAGNMDIDSFVPHSPHDPLDLPADVGGLAYLGRIKIKLDGGDNRTVIADHYMKWAFHFLVGAEKGSASYGLPLRLYGPTGVRFIYSNWTLEDPRKSDPSLLEIPKFCTPLSKTCRDMAQFSNLEPAYV